MIRHRMHIVLPLFEDRLRKAVAHSSRTLGARSSKQKPGMDHGRRSAVTGGKQMDGFCELVDWVLHENGLDEASIYVRSYREIPGFFRPTKEWNMLVVHEGRTVAAIEFTRNGFHLSPATPTRASKRPLGWPPMFGPLFVKAPTARPESAHGSVG